MVNYPQYPYYYPNFQQQFPQQPIQAPIQQPQAIQNQILAWVKDEKEAMDYPLTAGQSIFLMTQSEDYLYAKSCDQLGKTTFMKKRLIDESDNRDNVDLKEYIRREELEEIISDRIQREIERKFNEISFKPTKTRKPVIIDEE